MPEIKQRFQMPNSLKSPKMSIIEDIQTVFAKDPAARSTLEVVPVLSGPACPRDILDPEAGIDNRGTGTLHQTARDSSEGIARVKFMGLRQDYRIKA